MKSPFKILRVKEDLNNYVQGKNGQVRFLLEEVPMIPVQPNLDCNITVRQDMFVKHVCPLSAANYSCDKVIMHDF
jgi:hypothetical protein